VTNEDYYIQMNQLSKMQKEIHLTQGKLWYIENRSRKLETQKEYNKNHREKISEYRKKYYKEKGK